jgi:hypothetical protein
MERRAYGYELRRTASMPIARLHTQVWFPPVVRIKGRDRYVFLLAWRLDKHSKWHGHGAWLVREQLLWKGVDV